MTNVYVVHVTTSGGDHYHFAYRDKPTQKEVYEEHVQDEYGGEELEDVDCIIDIMKLEIL